MSVEVRVYVTLREKLGWRSKMVGLKRERMKFSELLDELKDLKKVLEDFGYENFMILLKIPVSNDLFILDHLKKNLNA
jgi:hypothetical protein